MAQHKLQFNKWTCKTYLNAIVIYVDRETTKGKHVHKNLRFQIKINIETSATRTG